MELVKNFLFYTYVSASSNKINNTKLSTNTKKIVQIYFLTFPWFATLSIAALTWASSAR